MDNLTPAAGEALQISAGDLEELARRLRARLDFELMSYKPKVLKRRIRTRLRAKGCDDLGRYLRELDEDPDEWGLLYKALIINVSSFFRNPETFRFLNEKVLPELLGAKAAGEGALMVSAGCSEGDEPYSLAMLLLDRFAGEVSRVPVRMVGIDVDDDALGKACRGLYKDERLKGLPSGYRGRFFTEEEEGFRLGDEVRSMVEFIRRDLRQGFDLVDVDLIICRNLLIYFSRECQRDMIESFRQALAPRGYLVIGKTETMIGELRSGFEVVDLTEHVYRKTRS